MYLKEPPNGKHRKVVGTRRDNLSETCNNNSMETKQDNTNKNAAKR